jgi:hypothetical protein
MPFTEETPRWNLTNTYTTHTPYTLRRERMYSVYTLPTQLYKWFLRPDLGGNYREQYPFILALYQGIREWTVMYQTHHNGTPWFVILDKRNFTVGEDYE